MNDQCCTPVSLNPAQLQAAAETAVRVNRRNHPDVNRIVRAVPDFVATPAHIAVLTEKYWGTNGVRLTVGFMESTPAELQNRILSHMNAWADEHTNVKFVLSSSSPAVRISRGSGGYWSYLGTDILHIPKNQQTMNLEGFTMNTPEAEFVRVVRHETGHTLGFPHEHLRRELVSLLDPNKTIAYFQRTQGWSPSMVRQQVLQPLDEATIRATAADQLSIMCYQIPGACTKSGQPILGGADIDAIDRGFAAQLYPAKVISWENAA